MDLYGPNVDRYCRLVRTTGRVSIILILLFTLVISLTAPRSISSAATNIANLRIEKTHSGDFAIGGNAVYLISVTNIGADPITGQVTVTDNLPASLTPVSVTAPNWSPCNFAGQVLTCVYANSSGIPGGTPLDPITILATVTQQAAPSVSNTAIVTNASDGDASDNTSTDLASVVSADLAVTKTASASQVQTGDFLNYTLRVRNNGPSVPTTIVLTDTLPSQLTFTNAIPTQGTYNNATGVWSVGSLGVNQEATLTINTLVNPGTEGLEIVNGTNGLDSELFDYNTNNNSSSVTVRVRSTRLIGLVTDAATDAPIAAANVSFTDSQSHAYNTTTNASGWYTFTATTAAPIAFGQASVTVTKSGYESTASGITIAPNVDNRLDFEMGTADLRISMTDGKTTLVPGEVFTYTLTVSNTGTLPAAQVLITDVLPTFLTYITDTLGIRATRPITGTYVWALPNALAVNARQTFRLRLRTNFALPQPVTAITNQVRVKTSTVESNTTNNSVSDTNNSTGSPNVGITLSVSPTQVRTGQNATYTIRVTNTGTAPVTEASVTDTFTTLVDLVSSTTTKGTATTNSSARRVTVNIGNLLVNETVTITVIVRVNNTATNNTTISHSSSISYRFGGQTSTRPSTTANFQVIASSTLPGTGGIEPVSHVTKPLQEANPAPYIAWLAALLTGLIGFASLIIGGRMRTSQPEWSAWTIRMGVFMCAAAGVFAIFGWGLDSLARVSPVSNLNGLARTIPLVKRPALVSNDVPYYPSQQPGEPERLPDFPIPTPTIEPSNGAEQQKDASPVQRIQIPVLNLDTVVKYVPYDGLTWLIAGLQLEVAWMGDTSWPGLGGNTALAGHVTLWNGTDGPFRYLEQLVPGDEIVLYTEANQYTYQVREQVVVEETDFSILSQTEQTQLTLITCKDFDPGIGFYTRRLAVFANLVETQPIKTVSSQ